MKSSQLEDPTLLTNQESSLSTKPTGIFKRLRNYIRGFKTDLRLPVPSESSGTFSSKVRWKMAYLFKKYGWKLLLGVFVYYLIRDVTLYIIIPYLIAKKILFN